jgi:hypothetical protein
MKPSHSNSIPSKTPQSGRSPNATLVFGAIIITFLRLLTKIENLVTFFEHKMAVPKHKKGEKLTLTDINFGKSGKQLLLTDVNNSGRNTCFYEVVPSKAAGRKMDILEFLAYSRRMVDDGKRLSREITTWANGFQKANSKGLPS